MQQSLYKFFIFFLKKYKYRFIFTQFFFLAWAIDATAWPYAIKIFIDKIIAYDFTVNIWFYLLPILLLFVFIWILIDVLFRCGGFMLAYFTPNILADIRMHLFSYVQHHSYNYFADNFAGNIANKISDMVSAFERIINFILFNFTPVIFTLVIIEIMFIYIQPYIGLLFLIWSIMHLVAAYYGGIYCSNISNKHAESRSILMGRIVDIFTNIINVKLFAKEHSEYINIKEFQNIEQNNNKKALISVEQIRIIFAILSFIFPGVLVHSLMIYSYSINLLTIGDLVLIFNVNWMITMMIWQLGMMLPPVFKDLGICKQALVLINAPHDITDHKQAKNINIKSGLIEFKNVCFYYNKNKHIFDNLNLKIEPGTKVGLVGYSGSGKSTFVNLLMRFFDINHGDIYLDNINIKNYKINALRKNIAMIPQDPSLFHRSILDNIKYGIDDKEQSNIKTAEIYKAAGYALCDFIDYLPDGYDTLVGERGVKLSGGQRQRIAIARAILKNAPILILDEATSALDSVTEHKIQLALDNLMKNKTTIIIAHRLSTLANIDRILVFENGKIIEDGSFDCLLAKRGHFYHMWQKQADGFLPVNNK